MYKFEFVVFNLFSIQEKVVISTQINFGVGWKCINSAKLVEAALLVPL